jgi:hypothetical protein
LEADPIDQCRRQRRLFHCCHFGETRRELSQRFPEPAPVCVDSPHAQTPASGLPVASSGHPEMRAGSSFGFRSGNLATLAEIASNSQLVKSPGFRQLTVPGNRVRAEARRCCPFVTSRRSVRCILFQSYSYAVPQLRQI